MYFEVCSYEFRVYALWIVVCVWFVVSDVCGLVCDVWCLVCVVCVCGLEFG